MDKKLKAFLQGLEVFRNIDPDFPSQQITVLLLIAERPGITLRDLVPLCRLSKAAVTRHIAALSDVGIYSSGGLGFIEVTENPEDRREKKLKLTNKGSGFLRTVASAMS